MKLKSRLPDADFWKNQKVFITGHTGFKGSWLSLWLNQMGSTLYGYALPPESGSPSLYDIAQVENCFTASNLRDIDDLTALKASLLEASPTIVFHLAAQPLVRESYDSPLLTFKTNVMGTVNLLEAVRSVPSIKSVVVVTTDKCYLNKEQLWAYREHDPLGGYDPYSSSKACAEIVTSSYRQSFFNPKTLNGVSFPNVQARISSARAGNVVGGGDWSKDRLIPDCLKALENGQIIKIRNPRVVRPWQHVLEPLSGYLCLAESLFYSSSESAKLFADAWNFGPEDADAQEVEEIVKQMVELWGDNSGYEIISSEFQPHEANILKLDITKSKHYLKWSPKWGIPIALEKVVDWTRAYLGGSNMREFTSAQISQYHFC